MSEPIAAVIGEALLDLVPTADEGTFTAHVGGSPLNVAVGLARLERPTAFLGRFSRDGVGRVLRGYAEAAGLNLDSAPDAGEPSSIARVDLDGDGVARYEFSVEGSADWGWTREELAAMPAGVRLVHYGSLASWLPPGNAVIGDFVRALRGRGDTLVSYDPNVRPDLLGDPAPARAMIESSVAAAHVVKASREDVGWLYDGTVPAEVAARWIALGPHLVIVTDGGEGATAYRRDDDPVARPATAVEVVDSVGAGDAFTSGLLDGLTRAGLRSPRDLERASPGAVTALLDHAALVAGLTCARAGADPPTLTEVQAAPADRRPR